MKKIFKDIEFQFDQIICVLTSLSDKEFNSKNGNKSSLGCHVRHVIEYIQILINAEPQDAIDYSSRKRDAQIENNRYYAIKSIIELRIRLVQEDRPLKVIEDNELFDSSYLREILYMHEHIVHHCAIMRLHLEALQDFDVDPCFGFAKSTLEFRNQIESTKLLLN